MAATMTGPTTGVGGPTGTGTGAGTGTGTGYSYGNLNPTVYATENKQNHNIPGRIIAAATHALYLLGAICALIGSALFVASQPRFFLSSPVAPFPRVTDGDFQAFCVLMIVASALWALAGILHIIAAFGEIANLRKTVGSSMGLISFVPRYMLFWAVFTFLGSVLILIGSCIWIGKSFDDLSAGSILWLIGFFFWAMGVAYELSLAMAAASMAPLMADMRQRRRAWKGVFGALVLLLASIFFSLGSILLIVIRPPGSFLVGALLFLAASIFLTFAHWDQMWMRLRNHVPLLAWLAAAAVVPTAVPAGGAVPTKPMDAGAAKGATQAGFVPMASEQKGAVGASAPTMPVQPTAASTTGTTGMITETTATHTTATTAAPANVNVAV